MGWSYEQFKQEILGLTNIDLSSYKERQMKRRIDSLMTRNGCNNYREYYALLENNKEKLLQFIDYITINVSEFFRNPAQWDVLKNEILPPILNKYRNIRVWSAGCSTGEEPYSVVMLLSRFLPLSSIRVLATDIDMNALEKARSGVYAASSLGALPGEFLQKYFIRREDLYIIDPKVKACVDFVQHDLLKDPFPDNCHIILCRNVIIYFSEEAKAKLFSRFSAALHPDGVLFVGSTEHIIMPQRYNLKSIKAFFYKRIQ
ncbi:MAG: protein-glutamate O-methyltransferase CheR [Clostridiales bacterium]|nr:protein-glutamate O-methyltransferase CheR [Clostridiales bacterium]